MDDRERPVEDLGVRVALVHQPWNDPTPPVQSGSIAIWIDRVAPLLAPHAEVVIYGKSPTNRWGEQRHAGVTYRFVPTGFDQHLVPWLRRGSRLRSNRPYFSSARYFATYHRNVARDLGRRGCDVVHGFNFSQLVPVVRRHSPGARIFLHMQCEWLAQLDRKVIGPRIAPAERLLGCSDFITRSTQHAFPDAADRCQTVYNGVDTAAFTGGEPTGGDAPRLIFVGRLSPEKGVHVLLSAFDAVLERHPRARLEIVGPGAVAPREFMVFAGGDPRIERLFDEHGPSYASDLRSLVQPKHASQVVFQKFVPHGELPALIRNADIAVFPSIWQEPFGMTVVEAMATETAVVASAVGGIPEIIEHDRSGLLVERDDPQALSAALLALLDDPPRRERLARAGHERAVERFSWERIAADVLAAYRD